MPQPSRVSRIVHRQAAAAVSRLLEADASKRGGASIKALTLSPSVLSKKATYALTCETLRFLGVIKELVAATPLGGGKKKVPPGLLYVLVYDLLFGQGLDPDGDAESVVLSHKSALKAALARIMVKRHVANVRELVEKDKQVPVPRYARVNTLKMSVGEAKRQLAQSLPGVQVDTDDLIPSLLVLPPGTDLHDHPMVTEGCLVLQGKASCLPAEALAPQPHWHVVDACAAPGNKTTHLAALIGLGGGGRVTACEMDAGRLKRLQANVELTGAKNVRAVHRDFLALDPTSPEFREVQAVLLDPSCSGSGTVGQRMDYLLPSASKGEESEEKLRITNLARFQTAALLHALAFPSVRRVVYSTCSVHREENEDVVAGVAEVAKERGLEIKAVFPQWPHRGLPVFSQATCVLRTDAARDKMDGFFVALFTRKEGNEPSKKRKEGVGSEGAKGLQPTLSPKKKRGKVEGQVTKRVDDGTSTFAVVEDMKSSQDKVKPSQVKPSQVKTSQAKNSVLGDVAKVCIDRKEKGTSEGKLRRRKLKRQRKKEISGSGTRMLDAR